MVPLPALLASESTADFEMDNISERSQKQGLSLLMEGFLEEFRVLIPRIFLALLAEGFFSPVCMQHAAHPQNSSQLLKGTFSSENQLDLVLRIN